MLMNSLLLYYNYPPTIMNDQQQRDYYKVLHINSMTLNSAPFLDFMLANQLRTIEHYLDLIEHACNTASA
jgi:hypothetical protein